MGFKTVNPANNQKVMAFESLSKEAAIDAVRKADEAFRAWRKTSFDKWKEILLQFAQGLRDRTDEFAKLITQEMGKRISEAREEIVFCPVPMDCVVHGQE
jgi:succinate-semialdehyde dehydrogenase/glutarate-semialdehyde dehydrogenase